MFQQPNSFHVCALTLRSKSSGSLVPKLHPQSGCLQKLKRFLKKMILVTEMHPGSQGYYISRQDILDERKLQIQSKSWLIHPFSTFSLLYDGFMCIILAACIITMPLIAGFPKLIIIESTKIVDFVLRVITFIDIFVSFHTGYVDPKERTVLMSQGTVARKYIFGYRFVCDLLSSVPVMHNWISFSFSRTLLFLGLLKLVRIPFVINYTVRFLKTQTYNLIWIRFTELGFVVFLVVHCFTCAWAMLPQMNKVMGINLNTSMVHSMEHSSSVLNQYLKSLLQVGSALLSIEYRHFEYGHWSDIVAIILLSVFGKLFFIYIAVGIFDLLSQSTHLEVKFHEIMNQLECFEEIKTLTSVQVRKIACFYNYKYRQVYFKEPKIYNLLSDQLKRHISMYVCRQLVNNCTIFNDIPKSIVENILRSTREEIFLDNDVIITAGTTGDCMYFLSSGTVSVITPSGREICHLQDGAYFGEVCLVTTEKRRIAHVIALEICETYALDRVAFRRTLARYPSIYQHIEEMAKERIKEAEVAEEKFKANLDKRHSSFAGHRATLNTKSSMRMARRSTVSALAPSESTPNIEMEPELDAFSLASSQNLT